MVELIGKFLQEIALLLAMVSSAWLTAMSVWSCIHAYKFYLPMTLDWEDN